MAWIMEAVVAARSGDTDTALKRYDRVLQAWPKPEAIVGHQVAAGIQTQIARLRHRARGVEVHPRAG